MVSFPTSCVPKFLALTFLISMKEPGDIFFFCPFIWSGSGLISELLYPVICAC